MYLADDAGHHRFLAFDFDTSKGNAVKDEQRFSAILSAAGIRRVATTSGPSGGRHIWVGLAEAPTAALVAELADLAASLYPSLDVSMLKNPRTGAVRPPFAPHRVPGALSVPDAPVDLGPLINRSTTPKQLVHLAQHLRDIGAELPSAKRPLAIRGIVTGADGHQQLKGRRRPLSARIETLLQTPPAPSDDLSRVAAAILAGCARARLSFTDVRALAERAPGLEHIRSLAHPAGGRVPRSAHGQAQTLQRKWRYALEFVAASPERLELADTSDFETRVEEITDLVIGCQAIADATPGRWKRAGYKDRLVLDAVCAAALAAVRDEVEMDVRRLSLVTGFGRTQTARALHSLREDGWLVRTAVADGPNGAKFRIPAKFSTSHMAVNRTQGVTRPGPATLPHERELALRHLELRLERAADGLYAAPRALGRTCGRIAAALVEAEVTSVETLAHRAGLDEASARYGLGELHRHGLVAQLSGGWLGQLFEHTLRRARQIFDVDEWLRTRATRVGLERYVWAWWSAELQWMRSKRKDKRRRKFAETAIPLMGSLGHLPTFPRYPKTGNKGDHRMARAIAETGGLTIQNVLELAA